MYRFWICDERVISTKLTSGRKRPEYKNKDVTREAVSYCQFGCFTSQEFVNLGREVCFMLNSETRWTTVDSQKITSMQLGFSQPFIFWHPREKNVPPGNTTLYIDVLPDFLSYWGGGWGPKVKSSINRSELRMLFYVDLLFKNTVKTLPSLVTYSSVVSMEKLVPPKSQ